jgi:FtsZ-interacting cell division protein ZipA
VKVIGATRPRSPEEENVDMDATQWIIVLVIVLVLIALAAWLMSRRKKQQQVEQAERLRTEAQQHATAIPEAQLRAREAEVQAERARLDAERAQQQAAEANVAATQQQAVHEDRLRTADEIDPNVDTRSDDYAPGSETYTETTTTEQHTVTEQDGHTNGQTLDGGSDGTHRH